MSKKQLQEAMQSDILKNYRTREELAAALGLTPHTLTLWERFGEGPPVTRIGRSVVYSKIGTDKWLRDLETHPLKPTPSWARNRLQKGKRSPIDD